MKKNNLLALTAVVSSLLVPAGAFGQNVLQWIGDISGGGNNSTNLGVSTNWATATSSNNQPTSTSVLQFNGLTTGPVLAWSLDGINHAGSGNLIGGTAGSQGVTFYVTGAQTNPVTIATTGFLLANTPGSSFGFDNIIVDTNGGQLILADNTQSQLYAVFRPSGGSHTWMNNSTNPVIINPNFQLGSGGASPAHIADFEGTGNWFITNNLRFNNSSGGLSIQLGGGTTILNATNTITPFSGVVTWAPGGANDLFNSFGNQITINAGTLKVVGPGVISPPGGNNIVLNGGVLDLNAPAQSDTIGRNIIANSGTNSGTLQVDAGTWTLSGANGNYSNLVMNGGEVIANVAESGTPTGPFGEGVIQLNGGTLGFSVNNTFDYSPRFSTAPNQVYSIDTSSYSVSFAANLASSGGSFAKFGGGTLSLTGTNSYSGSTTVNAGTLLFVGPMTGTGAITVADSATLGITESTGSSLTPSTLTLGSSAGALLQYNNLTNTATAPIVAGTIASSGTVTINVNSGLFTSAGQVFPLLTWTSGTAPAVVLNSLNGALGTVSTNGNTIQLNITSIAVNWTGLGDGIWNQTSPNDWRSGATPTTYGDPLPVVFDDSATGTTTITLGAVVQPKTIAFSDTALAYTVNSGPGAFIGGTASISKAGTNTVTLVGGANTNTGSVTINQGTLSVGLLASGGSPSDIGGSSSNAASIVLNGGSLQYTGGGATIDRLFSIGTAGGTLDNEGGGQLLLTNTAPMGFSGLGARTLTLKGNDTVGGDYLSALIADNGGATSLIKAGSGTWVLTANNTYSGLTTLEGGVVQIGTNGTTGSFGSGAIVNNAQIIFDRTNAITEAAAISGSGSLHQSGFGTLTLSGSDSYLGGTTIDSNTVLQVSGTGTLAGANITDNGEFIWNTSTAFNSASIISGIGNVWVEGTGLFEMCGANSYTGWTLISSGATFEPVNGNTGGLASPLITNNGTLLTESQNAVGTYVIHGNIVGTGKVVIDNNNQNFGVTGYAGTNTYTGGTLIKGGGLVLGDNATTGGGTLVGGILFTNTQTGYFNGRTVVFYHPEAWTFTNAISTKVSDGSGAAVSGSVQQSGAGQVTLTANNSYPGSTTIDAGTIMQVGNGGATGSIGSGTVAINGTLVFDVTATTSITNVISGAGVLVQSNGILNLANVANTFNGQAIISNGTMIITTNLPSELDLYGGQAISGAAYGQVQTNAIGGAMNINGGVIQIAINSTGNTTFNVAGGINATGGTLKVLDFGAPLVSGTVYQIFNTTVTGGNSMTIEAPGYTVENDLAASGSIKITAVLPPSSAVLTPSISGGQFQITWPSTWEGLHLQSEIEPLTVGIQPGTNWVTIPGTDAVTSYSTPATNQSMFFRLEP